MGAAVFSYDMGAWGESALAFKLKDHRSDLGIVMQTWQSIRILDYLCAPTVGRHGPCGRHGSLGRRHADDGDRSTRRPHHAERSGGHALVALLRRMPLQSGLPIHILPGEPMSNNAELGALAAPHPQLVISDGHDWTTTVPQIEYPPICKGSHDLYRARDKVRNVHLAAEQHDYGVNKRRAMYDFVAEQFGLRTEGLRNADGTYREETATVEHAPEMYVFGPEGRLRNMPSKAAAPSQTAPRIQNRTITHKDNLQ